MTTAPRDITRVLLTVLALGGLILLSYRVVQPFVGAGVWAATIVSATWPVMRMVERRLGGRRWMAVVVMTVALLLVFVIPLAVALRTIVLHEHRIVDWARALAAWRLGDQPPAWVATLPLVGATAVRQWAWLAHEASPRLEALASGHARQLMDWFIAEVGGLGVVTKEFLLTVVIAAVLFATGERAALGVRSFLHELAGDNADRILELTGKAIRGVVLGVVLGGALEAVLTSIGFAIAGVPMAVLLGAIGFLLCLIQIGTVPLLAIGAIWLFATGHTGAGMFLLAWTIFIAVIDQAVRPYLMKRGIELPLPLVVAGVIGGLSAFGLVGIFVGPVTLAVAATLLDVWLRDDRHGRRLPL
jgi:predicted PurR-regulated permease PerM